MFSRSHSLALACLTTLGAGLHAASAGKLVVEPPTLHCAGFHWEIDGDGNNNATAHIAYRQLGSETWREGMDFMPVSVDGVGFVAGSLFGLQPGTEYEARLTLVDPDGVDGEATQTVQFRTRTAPQLPEDGRIWHVYPDGHSGAQQEPLLAADGDWRRLLADAEASPLQPGDRIALHAGSYELTPDLGQVRTRSVSEVSTAPAMAMPEGKTVWHVYHPKHKGPKQEPTIRLHHYETPILDGNRKANVEAGDVVIFHKGVYQVDKTNYRERLFQGPKWGVWWFWGGGETGAPVVFKAAEGEEVIFDGAGNQAIFQMTATDHIWLDGFTFRNAQCALLAGHKGMDDPVGLRITNCRFDNIAMPVYSDTAAADWHLADNQGLEVIHSGPWYQAFGTIHMTIAGEPDRPIVLEAAGDGPVQINGNDNYAVFDVSQADHVWIRDVSIDNTECAVMCGLYPFGEAPDGLIVTGLTGTDVRMGIYGDESTGESWYLTDNRFFGRGEGDMSMNNHTSPFGISVGGRGHVIAYNHLEWFQDGIDLGWWDRSTSYQADDFTASVDIYGNYVYASGDNSVEADGSYFNGRFFDNAFITNNSPSTQSTPGAPYYFIRNIFYVDGGGWKLPSSIISLHNLYTSPHQLSRWRSYNNHFLNNLYMIAPDLLHEKHLPMNLVELFDPQPGAISDYNGYRRIPQATQEKPFQVRHRKEVTAYADMEAFAAATGFEGHSVWLSGFEDTFVQVAEPEKGERYTLEGMDFRLQDGSPAIDAGCVIPNVNESHAGAAPDLGPIEFGEPMPHYGPRT
jgi:hypothetical protein